MTKDIHKARTHTPQIYQHGHCSKSLPELRWIPAYLTSNSRLESQPPITVIHLLTHRRDRAHAHCLCPAKHIQEPAHGYFYTVTNRDIFLSFSFAPIPAIKKKNLIKAADLNVMQITSQASIYILCIHGTNLNPVFSILYAHYYFTKLRRTHF